MSPKKKLVASYVLDPSGVERGAKQADKHLSGLNRSFESVRGVGTGAFGALGRSISESGALAGPMQGILSGLVGGVGELGERMEHLAEHGTGFQRAGALAAGLGGTVAGVGAALHELGAPMERARKGLEVSVANAGKDYEEYRDQIGKTEKAEQKHAHRIQDTDTALATLTTGLHSPTLALKYYATVSDLAAARHISVASAADQVVKVYAGQTRAMKSLGLAGVSFTKTQAALTTATRKHDVAVKSHAKAQEHLTMLEERYNHQARHSIGDHQQLRLAHEAVQEAQQNLTASTHELEHAQAGAVDQGHAFAQNLDLITSRVHGQADAAVDNFAGRIDVMKVKVLDALASFGNKWGPTFMVAGGAATALGGVVDLAGGIIGKFGKGASAAITATEGLTAANEGLAVAEEGVAVSEGLALAPIVLVIAALAALGLAAYALWRNWDTVKDGLIAAWGAIEGAVTGIWGAIQREASRIWGGIQDFFRQWWPEVLGVMTGGVLLIPALLVQHWDTVKKDAGEAWGAVSGFVKRGIDDAVDFVVKLPGRVMGGLSSLGGLLEHAATGAWNLFLGGIRTVVDGAAGVVGFVGGIPGRLLAGLADLVGDVGALGGKAFRALKAGVLLEVEGAKGLLEFVAGLPARLVDAFGDLVGTFAGIGGNIVHGLVQGIKDKWHEVLDVIGDLASHLPGPIKHVLGLSSPSRVFAEIGSNIAEGLAVGITGNTASPMSAAAGMAARVADSARVGGIGAVSIGAASSSFGGAGSAGAGAAPATGGISVIVHVQGSVIAEHDLIEKVGEGLVNHLHRLGIRVV